MKSEAVSNRVTSIAVENELNETTLLIPQKDEQKDEADGVQSPTLDSKRIIDIVKPDGELQTVQVPAPPAETPTSAQVNNQIGAIIIYSGQNRPLIPQNNV